jgi:adenosylcobinamide-GDP ribazoletransferase
VTVPDPVTDRLGWLRLALTTFTIAPVRAPHVDRATAGRAMTAAPLMGALVGLSAAVVVAVLRALFERPPRFLVATLAVLVLVLASRALHLDGLADTVDALGSYRPAEAALALMKKGDAGPFGVVAIVFDLLVLVSAVDAALSIQRATEVLLVAAMTGRLAVTHACVAGIPAARSSGLGALVAGSVRAPAAIAVTAAAYAVGAAAGWVDEAGRWDGVVRVVAGMTVGLLAAQLLRRHAVRRLGGVTGDVLGALVEVTTAVTLVTLVLIRWPT